MSAWDTLGRVGLGIATGGLSEVIPAAAGAVGLDSPNDIDIKNLGKTGKDTNIGSYTLPPEALAAYTAIGNTQYAPTPVAAPGLSVGNIAGQYAIAPEMVDPVAQSRFLTNQDATRQTQVGGQQLDEATRLRGIVGGALTPADVDNQALLRQAQALQLSGASSARGGTDQRQTVQRDAAGNVVTLGSNNIAVLAAQRAQEQEAARAQLSQVLGQTQQQDALWQGAAYSIANADAVRAAQAASANQQAATTAAIAGAGARVSAAGVDQNAAFATKAANNAAGVRSYVDATGRVVAAGQGANAVQGVGISADAAYVEAQRQAREEQLRRQQQKLEYEKAKAAAQIQKTSAAVGAFGQVLGAVSGGAG